MLNGNNLLLGLEGLSAALSCLLRCKSFSFVRWNPWGAHLLESIYELWALYTALWIAQFLLSRQGTPGRSQKPRNGGLWLTILSGRFDSASRAASIVSLVLNSLCVLGAIDFVYRAHWLHVGADLTFTRMGYVGSSSAKIVVRHPAVGGIQIQYRPETGTADWQMGETRYVTAEDDYVTAFRLDNLQPDTHYAYRTNTTQLGTFKTASANPRRWTLVTSSCLLPFFPYNPLDHSLSVGGLAHLSRYVQSTDVDMMLFHGDFVYIDLPRRFGYETENYREAYRQVYASPNWTPSLRSLPWIHAYDDHEITNNWSSNETGIYRQAISPFMAYQHSGNPDPVSASATYYTFDHGDVSFFVMDTRRYRSPASMEDKEGKSMLGADQFQHFKAWLQRGPGCKVVVSSVPFTLNFRSADYDDYWAGYLWERQALLELMWDTEGVVIISGDRHEHATTAFPAPGTNDSRVIEFSTSPLSNFYPPADDYQQKEDSDMAINYLRAGLSKFGALTFDTSDPAAWQVKFDLIVNGERAWTYTARQTKLGPKKWDNKVA